MLVSFTPNAITQTWPPKLIPSQFTLENYQSLFKRLPIGREMLNTVIFAGAVTIISVFFDSLAAYGLSRVNFKGRGLLLGVLIATMMIPGMALLIGVQATRQHGPHQQLLGHHYPAYGRRRWHLPAASVLHLHSEDLDNAARIDGAGEFRIFAQIILPNAVPAILTVGMFNFMGNWNDLLWPLIMTSKPETAPSPQPRNADRPWFLRHPVRCGDGRCLISALPLLVVFFLVQKRFVEGIAMTGMK